MKRVRKFIEGFFLFIMVASITIGTVVVMIWVSMIGAEWLVGIYPTNHKVVFGLGLLTIMGLLMGCLNACEDL